MTLLNGALDSLVQKLDMLGTHPSMIDIADAIENVGLTLADVESFVQENPHSYNRSLVMMRENYELLVMTWRPGQGSVPHDHNGSISVLQVLQGQAAEGSYRVAPDGFVDLEYEELVSSGGITSFEDAGVHGIRNPLSRDDNLVTLHVYAPPLRDCRRFVLRPEPLHEKRPAATEKIPTVAVIGGGFSGAMTAANILHRTNFPMRVVLIERRGSVGEGVAYSTREPTHLLNVPASGMSAWPDRPSDFMDWASRRYGSVQPTDFLPRQWFGEYVRETLLTTSATLDEAVQFSIAFDEARRIVRKPGGGWIVHFERGSSLHADAIVLAIGHCPPSDPIGKKWAGSRTRFICDPWRVNAVSKVRPDEPVIVLGSGLTAVDAVLSLSTQPRAAEIILVSPNGLLPQGHVVPPLPPINLAPQITRLLEMPGGLRAGAVLRELRLAVEAAAATGGNWRSVVDGLRPYTARLWQAMLLQERRRFLSRLRPFWEVHRHRLALPISEKFGAMLASGKLRIIAGRVESAYEEGGSVRAIVRTKRTKQRIELNAGWVINCTGPTPSNRPEANPAIGSLLLRKQIRIDPLALGIETNASGNVIDGNGSVVPDMFVVGTLRKPETWESTAVPELRIQAANVGRHILQHLGAGRPVSVSEASEQIV